MVEENGLTDDLKAYLEIQAQDGSIDPGDRRLENRGVSDTYVERPDKLEQKILHRVQSVPQRMDAVLTEIEYLAKGGYFDNDYIEDKIGEEMDYEGLYSRSVPKNGIETKGPREVSSELGYRLGDCANELLVHSPSIDRSEFRVKLALGFLVGMYEGSSREMMHDFREISEFLKLFIEMDERVEDFVANANFEINLDEGWTGDVLDAIESHFKTILDERGIEPTEYILSALHGVHTDLSEYEEPDNHDLSDDNVGKWDVEGQIPAREVIRTVQEYQLEARQKLLNQIESDASALREVSWNEIPASQIVSQTPAMKTTVNEIAELLSEESSSIEKSKAVPSVAKIVCFLAGEVSINQTTRESPAVFEVSRSEERMPDWTVTKTAYGTVLHQILGADTRSPPSDYAEKMLTPRADFPTEDIQAAIEELEFG